MSKKIFIKGEVFTIVDDEDYQWAMEHIWSLSARGNYAMATIDGKSVRLHRVITNAPGHLVVDHINGNGLDNRRCNLRVCTQSQNIANSKKPSTNTSGYKGVSWKDGGWYAAIKFKGRSYHIGVYRTPELAHAAYSAKATELFGEFARFD